MDNIIYLQCKNKYGFTVIQLKIDYGNQTFELGNFKIGADRTVTRKYLNEKIRELEFLRFKEIKGAK